MAVHPNDTLDALAYSPSDAPYIDGEAVVVATPFVKGPCRAVWVGGVGDVVAVMWPAGNTVTFTAVPAGTELRICCTDTVVTVTTATLMVALY